MTTPLDYKLSKSFTWSEMTRTGQTALQDANRAEAEQYKAAIEALCKTIMQPIRDKFGPLRINSCFRGPAVNAKIGGSKTSQHINGEAADFVPLTEGITLIHVFDWIRKETKLPFGQVIHECPSPTSRWIHVSLGEPFRKSNNRQALYFDGKSYTPVK
jgi:zinc D-Ala-D-Ala carboxypeptidase